MGKHYIPNSAHKEEMLKEIGFSSIEDLFLDVPKGMVKEFNLPEGRVSMRFLQSSTKR